MQVRNLMLLCTVACRRWSEGCPGASVSSLEFSSPWDWTPQQRQTQNHRASSQLHLLLTVIVPSEDSRETAGEPELTGQACRSQLTRSLLGRTCHIRYYQDKQTALELGLLTLYLKSYYPSHFATF